MATSETFICRVRPASAQAGTPFWSLDLTIKSSGTNKNPKSDISLKDLGISVPADHAVARFLFDCLKNESSEGGHSVTLIRLIYPLQHGYVARTDFLERRLECCPHVITAKSFATPCVFAEAVGEGEVTPELLEPMLLKAIGGIQLSPLVSPDDVDKELENRLSFSWLLPKPLSLRRIAWVQGREDIDCIERALKAAQALGIKLVVMDEAGHWLQDPNSPWAYLREEFIAVDISPDASLPQRIVEAVRSYPHSIEGIVTISDMRLPAVAEACQLLGFPTESPDAYRIAGDKGRTRLLETVGAGESFVLEKAEDLPSFLAERQKRGEGQLNFPMVVKPVIGWCSDCVSKVHNEVELADAVRKASDRHAKLATPSTVVVIEPYVDGPEVDANFALLDGEIVFCDINDDFPSPADVPGADAKANFQETQNVMPSALPENEQIAIKEQILQSMLRQGFRSGLFHCEARVRNSSVTYGDRDGIIDLVPRPEPPKGEPEVYLHEINARPAGYLESVAVLLAYGVDYYALRMLLSLGPSEYLRFRALAQPFLNGPQFHLSVMIIQQTKAGIMKSADAAKEFLGKYPSIQRSVVDYYSRKKAGDILEGPDASALWWIAFLSVISRESRHDLLKRVDFIERNFEYEMVDTRS